MISVALIEDNRLMRDGLAALLDQLGDIQVVAAMATVDAEKLKEASPRLILLDFGLENGDGLAAVRDVRRELPDSRIIVMDLLPTEEDIVDVIQAGVAGFVMKDASLDDLENALRSVADGGNVLPPQVTNSLFSQIAADAVSSRGPRAVDDLRMTAREKEVIECISNGFSNKKIAQELHISIHTVKSHVRNIMEKLALHSRLQIAAWAHEEDGDP